MDKGFDQVSTGGLKFSFVVFHAHLAGKPVTCLCRRVGGSVFVFVSRELEWGVPVEEFSTIEVNGSVSSGTP